MALALQFKRLGDAFGMNWEGEFGFAFNLVKFSGIGLSLVLLACTVAVALSYRDPASIDPDDYRGREDEGILVVDHAGEVLHRVSTP